MTTLLIAADPDLQALADHSGDDSPHRADEPLPPRAGRRVRPPGRHRPGLTRPELARRSTVAARL